MTNFRDFRSKNKLKGTTNNTDFVDIGSGDIGKSSLANLLKTAKKNGSLNLANRNLTMVPKEVYNINLTSSNENESISFDGEYEGWWENVFLTKLVLVANLISHIDNDIALLSKLTHLDVSDNKIIILPDGICDLTQLRYLNVSKNVISSLPDGLIKLCNIQHLICSHNRINEVPNLSTMSDLDCLDISNNNLSDFPQSIANLTSLKRLDLNHNQISSMPSSLNLPAGLKVIDLSHNKLDNFSDKFCTQIELLHLHVNRLVRFPITCLHPNLKELSVTHNQIKTFTEADIAHIPNVATLAIANNSIAELTERISDLTMLANLDVSNNELRSLPFSLGNMDSLKSLSIEGNPFRAMKRTVIGAGTEVIKEYLRVRNTDVVDKNVAVGQGLGSLGRIDTESGSVNLDQADIRATGVVRLSSLGLTDLSDDIVASLLTNTIKDLQLNKNKLTLFPMRILEFSDSLLELDLSNNQLRDVPASIDSLRHLRRLNISNNQVGSLPRSLAGMVALEHLVLSYNPLGAQIPDVVYGCARLQSLHMSHCGIQALDATRITTLAQLELLDVSNNDISSLPAPLGLCENIKSLHLDGNSFKVPRVAIVAKGTAAVMEYLRSRIVLGQ